MKKAAKDDTWERERSFVDAQMSALVRLMPRAVSRRLGEKIIYFWRDVVFKGEECSPNNSLGIVQSGQHELDDDLLLVGDYEAVDFRPVFDGTSPVPAGPFRRRYRDDFEEDVEEHLKLNRVKLRKIWSSFVQSFKKAFTAKLVRRADQFGYVIQIDDSYEHIIRREGNRFIYAWRVRKTRDRPHT